MTYYGNKMKCPDCKSEKTKKVSVISSTWRLGDQRCLDCGYQDHWCHFSGDSLKAVAPPPDPIRVEKGVR